MPPLEDIDDELIEEPQINGEDGGDNNDGFILTKKSNKKRKLPKLSTDADQPDAKKGKDNVNWEMRKVSIPPHRYTPLKKNWSKLVAPIINELKMQIRAIFQITKKNNYTKTCALTCIIVVSVPLTIR